MSIKDRLVAWTLQWGPLPLRDVKAVPSPPEGVVGGEEQRLDAIE